MSSITKFWSRRSPALYFKVLNKNPADFTYRQKLFFHSSPFLNVKGQRIIMPSLSPTMSEGKIVKWLKKEGDPISPGDALCDIETDKAVVSLETEEEGILAKILISEDAKNVKVGTLIALMVAEGEDWKQVEIPKNGDSETPSSSPGAKEQDKQLESAAATGPTGIEVKMPALSPTMTTGTIVKWYKKEGDAIATGDVLCDIQTDKSVISYESDEDGILAKIIVPQDSKDVKVGQLIALIVSENEDWKNVVAPQKGSHEKIPDAQAPAATIDHKDKPDTSGISFGPAVRSLLSIYHLDPRHIKATGRNNLLLKEDVLKFVEENKLQKKPPKPVSLPSSTSRISENVSSPSAKAPAVSSAQVSQQDVSGIDRLRSQSRISGRRLKEPYVDIEVSNIRRVIAKRLTESKHGIPHAYCDIRCQVDHLLNVRKDMNAQGMAASVNDYIIKAAAYALQECPKINVISANDEYVRSQTIDIAVAVATPNGLITPIVQNADTKTVTDISQNIKELAKRAREGKLKPHEFQGGSFTISNLGMFGIKNFTAIINPPQIAILAVGSAIDRYAPDQKTYKDVIFTLSYDRRALQEDEAAQFLETLKYLIENPKKLVAGHISVRRSLSL